MTYYAQRKSIDGNGNAVAPNNRYGERAAMERQYHLYCASSATNADGNSVDAVEWGTIEGGAIERKRWTHEIQQDTVVEATAE